MRITLLLIASCCFFFAPVFAQLERGIKSPAQPYKRTKEKLALVIGNTDYQYGSLLPNATNDADSMATCLKRLGFDVLLSKNLNIQQTQTKMNEFSNKLKDYSLGLFFFAGHGSEAKGENFLYPVDADPTTTAELNAQCYSLNRLLKKMDSVQAIAKIVIVDACRTDVNFDIVKRGWTQDNEEEDKNAKKDAPDGALICFATSPGRSALEYKTEKNGIYTQCLLANIQSNISVFEMLTNVNNAVRKRSNKYQIAVFQSSLNQNFYFNNKPGTSAGIAGTSNTGVKTARSITTLVSGLELLNGARYEQSTNTDYLTFVVLPGNKLSFSGKMSDYSVFGKLKQVKNMNFQVMEGNTSGTLSFLNDNELVTISITIKGKGPHVFDGTLSKKNY